MKIWLRCQSSSSSWIGCFISFQFNLEDVKEDSCWGSGMSSDFHPKEANSSRRPFETAAASCGSPWSVKYKNGVDAPYSSP